MGKNKITAIIQARLGSSRLPGKTFMTIQGKTLLQHLITRAKASKIIDEIIIATTNEPRDDVIETFANDNNIRWYRGDEHDVLDRFYWCAFEYQIKNIVRITPDCPLIDPKVIAEVIKCYKEGNYDYVSNTFNPTFPAGNATEIFSFEALETAWFEAKSPIEREHVTPYIYNNPKIFNVKSYERQEGDLSHLKWMVDTKEDFEFVMKIFNNCQGGENGIFSINNILEYLREK